ncbi:MAG: condensation domain-containing protein, partial [Pyrinomonadaceae bacterium]
RRAWESFGGRVEIVNEYGPTEATVGCMIHRYDPDADTGARVPIGRPAANAHVYVVDGRGREVGDGVAGELLVSGEGVAEGYHNRSELTAERFGEDTYRPGARLYRTGDVARRVAGGLLDYLGRHDEQVKYHGHRVELGEIRVAVNSHPEVRDSVVRLARRAVAGGREVEELVCYYVARRELDAGGLREHLRERVIEETVPSRYVRIGRVPLTLNGKVNYEALPDPWGGTGAEGAGPGEASETELALAGVWAEVLGVGEVSRGDNFFELGGHSLLATLVVMRVEELFGVGLALRSVFEAPTVAELAALIDAAVREKAGVATPPLIPAQRSGPLPLSFAQQRLWFLDRLSPEAASYNVPVAYRIEGRLDVDALERSLNRIVERHEVLRTTIALAAGEPVQVISPHARLTLQLTDLGAAPPSERQARARAEVEEEGGRPFDLGAGPVIRARLLRLADEEHVLVVTMHHIVSDAWSLGVFVRELSAFYEAEAGGVEARLPGLTVQYADYAAWQRGWLRGEELERQLEYWREQLAGAPTVLELPADRPRPKVQTSRGAVEQFEVGGEVLAGLKAVAREEGATLFMTLLAAFGVLLSRYTGQKDFLVGTPIANRGQKELEGLIGFFVNTLALRMQIEDELSFRALVRKVRETCLGAYAHQDVPFEAVVEELQPERDLSRPPLFQITFAVQSDPGELPSPAGLTLAQFGFDTGTSKFEISAAFSETKGRLVGFIQYNTGLFEQETIARLASHLTVLLEHAVERAGDAVSELPLLTRVEVEEALVQWNQTETEYPSGRPVQRLFEEQAARRPDAVALVSAAGRLTYGELNRRANRLARHLRARGLSAGESVGVYLERGAESVAAVLGVLKAGGACLPLDPTAPKPELTRMLAAARPHLLLTQQKLMSSLPEWRGPVVSADAQPEEAAGEEDGDFDGGASPDGVAFVLFEREPGSGYAAATHTHEAVCNGVLWMRHALRLGGASRVLHKAPAAGTWAAWWEVLPTLASGGALVVAEAGKETDAAYLSALVREHGVSVAHFAPALLEDFLDECGVASCASLTHVLCSGAPLPRGLQERFRGALGAELHNLYAPAAAAFAAAHWVCRAEDGGSVAPAGHPIANGRLYVLDADLRPAPVGVTGRLYLGGLGPAHGFLSEAGATGGGFVTDPFSRRPGSRLLDTGEAARYRADGSVERLTDAGPQVKIRGYGVTLNEVEAHLRAHPDIARAACLAVDDGRGDKRLVAYLVPAAGHDPEATADEARAFLNERLPDYAVPSDYVTLAALPLAADGTPDRAALPAPAEAGAADVFVAPVTETEQVIAALWRESLETDSVGVHDNFFDLGGHSLLLAQLHVRLTEIFGDALTSMDLFRYPTISSLAAWLGERLKGSADAAVAARALHQAGAAVVAPAAAEVPENAVAIIGMAVRLPGCRNVAEFWEKLKSGAELLSFFSDEELAAEGTSRELLNDPNYVRAAGFLADADHFDAPFFGIRPREAEAIDPQQRQFLECAWEALEDACYDPERYEGRIGVYAGVGMSTYLNHVSSDPELMRALGGFQAVLSNDKDFLPLRVSYKLNLRGPSVSVQTSCSTSLVAVHMACRSLLAGECDIALGGGVRLSARKHGYLHQEGGITSPDGHCRAFDAAAAGTVPGSGVGIVVLKRLRDALADGDRVEAVILGSAINNDGSLKIGFTAPSIEGQAAVIAGAHAAAGVSPETITYVEAHGTGTALGDPIEVAALTQAFCSRTQKKAYCGLGSVKTNVGHLDAAAGVCGLVKTVLALKHRELPPSLHYREANPQIDFASTPFYVNNRLRPWETAGAPRRAGVSSFGIGGTNAHVVLEEAPPVPPDPSPADGPQLLIISAKTPTALDAATANLRAHLRGGGEFSLRDVAYSLQVGRAAFEHRRVVVARGRDEAAAALESLDPRSVSTAAEKLRDRPVAFIFPGQGAQHVGMGAGLYESYPVFREQVDGCCELLKRHTGTDLREIIYPRGGRGEEAARLLEQTANAQPALFVIEYAAARLWGELGVRPQAMLGHSVGEYVAACLAGVFSLEDALMLVARRGQLVQSLPAGRMLAVHLPERELESLLGGGLCVAAVNGPELCVVSGPAEAVEEFCQELERREVECHPLHTSHAFHSEMVEPIIAPFVQLVKQVELKPLRTPYVSNLTGTWVKPSQAMDPHYWGDHLRRVVRFSDGLQDLLADARAAVLEVGPGAGLGGLVKRHPARAEGQEVLASMRRPKDRQTDQEFLLRTLGALWLRGVRVEWAGLYGGARPQRLRLPLYPFERRRYWVAPPAPKAAESRPAEGARQNGDTPARAEAPGHVESPAPSALVRVEPPPTAALVAPAATQVRAASPLPGNGHAPEPTPTQQIIAHQLRIGAAQLKLMRLQLETLRHGNGKNGR